MMARPASETFILGQRWLNTATRVIRIVPLLICATAIVTSAAEGPTNAPAHSELATRKERLEKNLPDGFTIVVQPPFVVIGDEPSETVRRRASNTVIWAVTRLKQAYFEKDPAEIIEIWLFKDGESYTNQTQLRFNCAPASRFGFYDANHAALIMNISTGAGTLVHELVHPFMRANFPQCPVWFNEGLASLYEASTEKAGKIKGLINWRFKELEQDIRQGRTISFARLASMSDREFYEGSGGSGHNRYYAEARYLCYYLQEKGLLQKFYHAFLANAKKDPTGIETLKEVVGEKDLEEFRKKWEKFVLELRPQ